MSRCRKYALLLALPWLIGCADNSQQPLRMTLSAAGRDTPQFDIAAGDNNWQVQLERAELAFGPFVLCPGAQAGDLCDIARAEWLGSAVVNVLSPTPQTLGSMAGFSGTTRPWMYDVGITSMLTEDEPVVLAAAAQLDDNSVIIEARATRQDGLAIPFRIALPIRQDKETETGVPVIRKSGGGDFEHDLSPATAGLTVVFDAQPWLGSIDFEGLVLDDSCSVGGPEVVCSGSIARSCDADGNLDDERDCAANGGFCQDGKGCVAQLELTSEDQSGRALRNAVVAGEHPQFVWQRVAE